MRSAAALALALVTLAASACATADGEVRGLGGGGKADDFAEAADVDVEVATIEGSMLSLEVTYAGGEAESCAEHDFILDWDETFTDGFPRGAELQLMHDANGDTCTDPVWTVLHFDLAGLADAYVDSYDVESATVPLTIVAGDESHGVTYAF
jgi:hypothetical protein